MKTLKILVILLPFIFASFSNVEAAGLTGGSRSSSSFKPSTPKVSTPKISTPRTNTTPKSNIPKINTPKTNTGSTKQKSSTNKYEQKTDWSKTLLTAAGIYLILDSFDDDGRPIYVNEDTGEKITAAELEDMNYKKVDTIQDKSSGGISDAVSSLIDHLFSGVLFILVFGLFLILPFMIIRTRNF